MTDSIDLAAFLKWGHAKEVRTKAGPRMLQTAKPTDEFWEQWNADPAPLKSAGISLGKHFRTGDWEVCWWRPMDETIVAARAEAVEASRATDANIDVPAPEGLAYLPYQRAGIAFCLKMFGDIP